MGCLETHPTIQTKEIEHRLSALRLDLKNFDGFIVIDCD